MLDANTGKRVLSALLLAVLSIPVHAAEALATFAGGCFWSTEKLFDAVPGVISTTTGYTGGDERYPTYESVTGGRSNHREAVQLRFDSDQVSYQELLITFWHGIDPLDKTGQFCDYGHAYTTAIYTHNADQAEMAAQSREYLQALKFRNPIVTEILPAKRFHPAEAEHQNFSQRSPDTYLRYRQQCGTDMGLRLVWR